MKNIKAIKDDITQFCCDHKKEIILTGAVAGGVVILALTHKNNCLKESLKIAGKTIAEKDARIEQLQGKVTGLKILCNAKDTHHLEVISDGLRHGSPLCAQDLADYRWYLHENGWDQLKQFA